MAKGQKTGGRQKGTPNKVTGNVREMVLRALDKAGGEEYLLQQAKDNPNAFMALVGKVLPTQITGPNDGPIKSEVSYDVSNLTDDQLRAIAAIKVEA